MVQYFYPVSDITNQWASGGWAQVDDNSDTDYAYTDDNPSNLVLEMALPSITDPGVAGNGSNHFIIARGRLFDGGVPATSSGTGCSVLVELVQGTTVIASNTIPFDNFFSQWYPNITMLNLTAGQADSISDWADLRIRLTANGGGGSPSNRRGVAISSIELGIPDAPSLSTVQQTYNVAWNILDTIEQTYDAAWNILDTIQTTFDTSWDVEVAGPSTVEQTFDIAWDIGNLTAVSAAIWDGTTVAPNTTGSGWTIGSMTPSTNLDVGGSDDGDGDTVFSGTFTAGALPGSPAYSSNPTFRWVSIVGSEADAISTARYFEFTVARTDGRPFRPEVLAFNIARGGLSNGRGFAVYTSADGYTTPLMSVDNVPSVRATWTHYDIDMRSVEDVTSLTIRIYTWTTNTLYTMEADDFSLTATVGETGLTRVTKTQDMAWNVAALFTQVGVWDGTSLAPASTDSEWNAGSLTDGGMTTPILANDNSTPNYASQPTYRWIPGNVDESSAIANNRYFEVTISRIDSEAFTPANLRFNAARGGSSTPRGFSVYSDADSYASALLVETNIPTVRNAWTAYDIDLSGIGSVTSLTLRFYSWSTSTASSIEMDDMDIVIENPAGLTTVEQTYDIAWDIFEAYSGTATSELGAITQSATGEVVSPVFSGTISGALGSLTQDAAGTSDVPHFSGTADSALGSLTQTAVGTTDVPHLSGDISAGLVAITQVVTGSINAPGVSASGDSQLPGLTQASAATVYAPPVGSFSGAFSSAFDVTSELTTVSNTYDLAWDIDGPPFSGTIGSDLGALTQDAVGSTDVPHVTGIASSGLGSLTQDATGTRTLPSGSGTIGSTLQPLSQDAAGTTDVPHISGDATSSLGAISQSAAGATVPPAFSGTADSTLGSISTNLAGSTDVPHFNATAASNLGSLSTDAAGTTEVPHYSGTIDSGLPALTQSATGSRTIPSGAGIMSNTLPSFATSATGSTDVPHFAGVGDGNLGALTQAATGSVEIPASSGTISSGLAALSQAAAGTYTAEGIAGNIDSTLAGLSQSFAGTTDVPHYSGTTSGTLGALTTDMAGSLTGPAFTGAIAGDLRSLVTDAAGSITVPGFTGSVTSSLAAIAADLIGSTDIPHYAAGITSLLPGMGSSGSGATDVPHYTGTASSTLPWAPTAVILRGSLFWVSDVTVTFGTPVRHAFALGEPSINTFDIASPTRHPLTLGESYKE